MSKELTNHPTLSISIHAQDAEMQCELLRDDPESTHVLRFGDNAAAFVNLESMRRLVSVLMMAIARQEASEDKHEMEQVEA